MQNTQETMANQKYDKQVEAFDARYGKVFESIAKSATFKGTLSKNDRFNLGSQIDNYKKYESYVAENGGSAASLGALPRIALDLISASYALSIAPQLASMQSLDDSQGIIYYKKAFTHGYPLTAVNGLEALPEKRWMNADGTYGDQAQTYAGEWKKWLDAQPRPATGKDDTLDPKTLTAKNFDATTFSAFKGWQASPTAYISEKQVKAIVESETIVENIVGATRWNVPMSLRLIDGDGKIHDLIGVTAGPGQLPQFYGDVKVTTSASDGNLIVGVPSGYTGMLAYHVDFEKAPDVPAIEYGLETLNVEAEIMAVKETLGTFKSYQFNKRFGKAATDEQLADLSGHMAMAESEKVIRCYVDNAAKWKPITWSINRPAAVSEYEHRQSFLYAIQAASAAIGSRAGKGRATKIVAGYDACQYIQSLPTFKAATQTNLIGPHVFGTLESEGITVIRSNTVVAPNEVICAYVSDASPFEAPAVCATYMPVFLTDTLPVGKNPFVGQRAIASWKAITPVVAEFCQRIILTKNGDPAADVNVFLSSSPVASSSNGSGSNG